jgi:signal peptidase II
VQNPSQDPAEQPAASRAADAEAPVRSGHGRLSLVLGVAAAVVLVDLVTKLVVVARLEGEDDIRVVGDLLRLTVIRNSGAAFGLGAGFTVLFSLVAVAVAVVVVRQARRLRSTAWAIAFGALLGGALGNLVDRVLREPGVFQGHVVDWVRLPSFPVFNVADAAITCAGVAVVVLTLLDVPFEGRRARAEQAGGQGDEQGSEPRG